MAQPKGVDWTVVILTCQYKDNVQVFQRELEVRQKREQIPARTLLLAVEDPEMRVGSGGATLNALLVAAEHLSARAGFTVSAHRPVSAGAGASHRLFPRSPALGAPSPGWLSIWY
uniref:Uncharacterized protein n=1 Tax=Suricata suricatta TaxID=37032 RepID=A0A673V6Y2_SURSU